MAPSATRARFEPDRIQQFATGNEGKQAGETTRGQDEAYVLLRPFLLGQINRHIGTETGQHSGVEKIDSVKSGEARARRRGNGSIR